MLLQKAGEYLFYALYPNPNCLTKTQVSDVAVGLFDWARDNREKFYAIWTGEGRRREDGGGEKKKAAKKSIREMKEMLEETLVAAKRIELEAAAKAETRVKLERELDSYEQGQNDTSEGDYDGAG